MASKLYPSLEEFYKNNNIEEGDEDIWYSVSDHKLYRTRKRANKSKDIANDILSQKNIPDDEVDVTECFPTAPPWEELSLDDLEDLENHPDYSILMDQTLPPPYSDYDPLAHDTSWIDDLQPDYDDDPNATSDDTNNMNKSTNSFCDNVPIDARLPYSNTRTKSKTQSKVPNPRPRPGQCLDNGYYKKEDPAYPTTQHPPTGNKNTERRNGKDYMAWVSWRKQVNRQLAALILLRRGGQVRLQTIDLSRKPLSQSSMKEVFQRATNDCSKEVTTSLNGKPYIMYGIPRVVLAKPTSTK